MNGLGLMALRLVLAAVFIAHGANKLFGLWAGPGIGVGGTQHTAQLFAALGLEPNFPLAVLVGTVELLGGVLLAIGWFTRVAAPALIIVMGVAIWKLHAQWGFFLNWMAVPERGQGIELHVVLIGALLCLTLAGAGEWSIDGTREKSAASRAAGRARLRGKL
ncbi:MAG: DoxX family protein, partial [Acidobacteria bacterium]|nr:DoxX family protein [Acidobacteriota bacterium]